MNMTLRVVRALVVAAALVVVLDAASVAWACPTCREGLADSPQGQGVAAGFYYSILFMMSMPFIVLGTLVSVAYRSVLRAKGNHDAQALAEVEA